MTYQPTPRKAEIERRLNTVRQALAPRVSVIVGDGTRGYSGLCLRLRHLHDARGNAIGYRVRLDDIRREQGQTLVRSTESVTVASSDVWIEGERNLGGGTGAICVVPNSDALLAAATALLRRPTFGAAVAL